MNTCLPRLFPTVNLIFMIIAMALAAGHDCQQTAALAVGDTPYTDTHTHSLTYLAFNQWEDR